jgi:lycopene cyclase domain-containing protein
VSYLGLVGIAVVLAAVPLALAVRSWAARGVLGSVLVSLGFALVVLCVLTVVFDSVMIDADLFRYGTGSLTGLRLWRAPIEDLGYPLVAVMLLPAVWELLSPATSAEQVER